MGVLTLSGFGGVPVSIHRKWLRIISKAKKMKSFSPQAGLSPDFRIREAFLYRERRRKT